MIHTNQSLEPPQENVFPRVHQGYRQRKNLAVLRDFQLRCPQLPRHLKSYHLNKWPFCSEVVQQRKIRLHASKPFFLPIARVAQGSRILLRYWQRVHFLLRLCASNDVGHGLTGWSNR